MSDDGSYGEDCLSHGASSGGGLSSYGNRRILQSFLVQVTTWHSIALDYAKVVVFLVFAAFGCTFAVLSQRIAHTNIQDNFSNAIEGRALELSALLQNRVRNTVNEAIDLSLLIAHETELSGVPQQPLRRLESSSWIHVADFPRRGRHCKELGLSLSAMYAPLVADHTEWEDFVARQKEVLDPEYDEVSPIVVSFNATPPESTTTAPIWQLEPFDPNLVNVNLLSMPSIQKITMVSDAESWLSTSLSGLTAEQVLFDTHMSANVSEEDHVFFFLLQPIVATNPHRQLGFTALFLSWESYLSNLSDDTEGLTVVVNDTCGETFTFELQESLAMRRGPGDLHDRAYDELRFVSRPFQGLLVDQDGTSCDYTVSIYPTEELEAAYTTNHPTLYPAIVVVTFLLPFLMFIVYELNVRQRHKKLMAAATRTHDIMSSFFPTNVRNRILKDAQFACKKEVGGWEGTTFVIKAPRRSKKSGEETTKVSFDLEKLGIGVFDDANNALDNKDTIAEFFPEVTVMYADISGFTAWSSVREPYQVFVLLETLFSAFDEVAKRRHIFKVETVGDCYVAATGLPDHQPDHAVRMARFARQVIRRMNDLTKVLEVEPGPDTADLRMRVGIHTGAVTAGVLRGDKSRFQLFGETMNVTAKIEGAGMKNKVHLSQQTADALISAGKRDWILKREDNVQDDVIGNNDTYWLVSGRLSSSIHSVSSLDDESNMDTTESSCTQSGLFVDVFEASRDLQIVDGKVLRLVNWNVDVIVKILVEIAVRRESSDISPKEEQAIQELERKTLQQDVAVLDEVKEICDFDAMTYSNFQRRYRGDSNNNNNNNTLPRAVVHQVRQYVQHIAFMYNNQNPFHNFEHASHVLMSTVKLLSRIVTPNRQKGVSTDSSEDADVKNIYFGISTDPVARLACVFSALIHDADHQGVTNSQLMEELPGLAKVFHHRSVAEQNSIYLAWKELMQPHFLDLRRHIYASAEEFKRFRQLVVNCVMATDIMDKDLKNLRNGRWEKAFPQFVESTSASSSSQPLTLDFNAVKRKTTIVIEHLIQASDVSHTMQHWSVFVKWNERLFMEMHKAFAEGRSEKDPSEFWYKGEIGFFDFYIIPLANKLKKCGVFGVSHDEYLNYAKSNRRQWEIRGEDMLVSYMQKIAAEGYKF